MNQLDVIKNKLAELKKLEDEIIARQDAAKAKLPEASRDFPAFLKMALANEIENYFSTQSVRSQIEVLHSLIDALER